jgi:hypothetical protein
MTRALVAEFDDADRFIAALKTSKAEGLTPLDALMPFHISQAAELLAGRFPPVRLVMGAAGFGMAILAYALQWYSAVIAYPIDSGGRPLNSWPIFLLVPFEIGILAAAIAGFVTFIVGTGLPRLHHPLFAYPGIERATQDRFFVLVARTDVDEVDDRARRILFGAGAVSIGAWDA